MLKRMLGGAAVVIPALAADRLTKVWAQSGLVRCEVIPDVLGFRFARNTGVAFSMLSGVPWLVSLMSAVLVIAVVALLLTDKSLSKCARFGLWLVAAGGLGNLYDRIAYGYVVDFIELLFVDFAVFNVADICVCCGAALACFALVFIDGKKERTTEEN